MQEVTSNENSTLKKQCSHRFTRECGCSCRSKLYYHTIATWHIWYFEVPSECSLQYMVMSECIKKFALLALKTTQSTILRLILLLSLPSQDIILGPGMRLCWYQPTHAAYLLTWWPSLSVGSSQTVWTVWTAFRRRQETFRALHLLRQLSKPTF